MKRRFERWLTNLICSAVDAAMDNAAMKLEAIRTTELMAQLAELRVDLETCRDMLDGFIQRSQDSQRGHDDNG